MKTQLIPCLLLSLALTARAADPASLVKTESALEHAALRGDAAGVKAGVAEAEAALATAPNDPAALYERAFAHYAEASVARAHQDKAEAARQMKAAAEMLENVNAPAWSAEALALRGYMCNQMIGVKGMAAAMSLGPKSSSLLGKARGMAPSNPRVLFFNGVVLVTTPEMWGGDLTGGIDLLAKAVEIFDHQPAGAFPKWGEAEALAWLGIGRQKKGDLAGARTAWEHALAIEPGYGWVRAVLMPSLDKGAAGTKQ